MSPGDASSSSALEAVTSLRAIEDQRAPHKVDGMPTGDESKGNTPLAVASREDTETTQAMEEKLALQDLEYAAQNNGDEEIAEARSTLNKIYRYSGYARSIFEDENSRGLVERRTMQASIHTAFTEIRLQELEMQLRKVRADLYKLPEDFEVKTPVKRHPVYWHILRRSAPDKFEVRTDTLHIPTKDRPALEVSVTEHLVGESGTHFESGSPNGVNDTGVPGTYLAAKRLRIRPLPLIAHLRQITRVSISRDTSPPLNDLEQGAIVFLKPFKLFVTYEEEIRQSLRDLELNVHDLLSEQKAGSQAGETFDIRDLLQDLKLLVNFMDEDLKPTLKLRRGIREGTITDIEYQDLWHLFKCGDMVLVQSDTSHAYRVLNFTGGRETFVDRLQDGEDPPPVLDGFTIDCLSITFDGSNYTPQLNTFSIRPFLGSRPITSLPVYPLRFDKDNEKLRQDFIAQGELYLDLTIPPQSHKYLQGRTLDEPPHDIDGQVIIDTTTALSRVPEWRPKSHNVNRDQFTKADPRETHFPPHCGHVSGVEGCCGSDICFRDLSMDEDNLNDFIQKNLHLLNRRKAEDLDEEDLMLLPHAVHGFVLRSRQWVTMRTVDLSEVKFQNSFEDLMIPPRHKSTVQALVQVHESAMTGAGNSTATMGRKLDIVSGKGAGLILLLHGEPGVGKTSTAECVADHTKRPLFPITCGDIGETATEVEEKLQYNFSMAHKWGCVLLLDEADVFLAKRNKTDLRRNAVTSVFLRCLEYYAGILFLTTNRVGSIDPAFKSRIHISLFFPKFDLETSLNLYSTYIKRTRAEQERLQSTTFKIKEKEILKFAERHFRRCEKDGVGTWNGRQIRNAFQAAVALVEYEAQQAEEGDPRPTLGKEQFNIVAESSREFDKYLISTLGAAEADIARQEQWRSDHFGTPEVRKTVAQSHDRKKTGFYGSKYGETDDDENTSSDDESDDDDDDEDDGDDDDDGDDGPSNAQRRTGKKAQAIEKNDGKERDEFQEYLRWKNARKSGKGRN